MTKRVLMVASVASLLFALGAGTAAADPQENPCGENPCAATNPCGDAANPCAQPCGEANPCGDVEGDAAAGAGDGAHSLTLPVGKISVGLTLTANLGEDAIFEPASLSPDVWYGVMDNLTIGLAHSSYGSTGFIGGAGTSICVTGEDKGCGPKGLYTNGLVEGRYQFLNDGTMAFAGQLGLGLERIDPDLLLEAKIGLMARFHAGSMLMIDVNPNVFIGITEREGGNKEDLNLPITLSILAAPNVAIMLQTGVYSPFKDIDKLYGVPVSLGGMFWVTPQIGIAAAISATRVLDDNSMTDAFDGRTATLAFCWHN